MGTLGTLGSISDSDKPTSYDYDEHGIPINHPKIISVNKQIKKIEDSLDRIDEKFLNNEISEEKHEKMTSRFEEKKIVLEQKKEEIVKALRVDLVE